MFITKRHLSRRTVLRGIGASVALPLLDSMVGAQTPVRSVTPKTRFAAFYVPHGATMDKWTPATEGPSFEYTEILKPLEQFRERITVVSGLAHPYVAGAGGADVSAGANHTRAAAVFLTGSVPQRGAQAHLGVSADQVAAQHIGQDTRSLLDSVMTQLPSLQRDLPPGDRRRLDQYLVAGRLIARRIQRAEASAREDVTLPDVPAGVPATFAEHIKLMMDLQVLAFQSDITRVSTLMLARELSGAVFPETTIRDPFHNLSHHSNDRGNMDRFAILNLYHMTKFAYFVLKLKETPDGDGSLLDHSLVLYGSSLSDGNQHNFSPLPIVLAGGASGAIKGGRHVRYPKDTHMSNLLLALLDKLGARLDTFGDSTEMLSI